MNDEHELWAVVEIMGRKTRVGRISEAQIGGATLLSIEDPRSIDKPDDRRVEFYSPQAIFAIRPCTREQAEALAPRYWYVFGDPPALPPGVVELIDDEGDQDDDDTVWGEP